MRTAIRLPLPLPLNGGQKAGLTVHGAEVLSAGGGRQRRHGILVDAIDVGSVLDKQAYDVGVSLDGRQQDGRLAVGRRTVGVDAAPQQRRDRVDDAVDGGVVQSRTPVLVHLRRRAASDSRHYESHTTNCGPTVDQ